jgi:hypothetical protein
MEKISNIVRSNSRVAAVDLKSSAPVRPGVFSYGRPIGESPKPNERAETTAARAAALSSEMNDIKHSHAQDRSVGTMADSFFMTRMRRPEEPETDVDARVEADKENEVAEQKEPQQRQPAGFKPRGSYVNVEA